MLRTYFVFIIVILQFSTILPVYGQFANIQYLTTDEGLFSNGISEIAQDSLGYIWIGTSLGLSRLVDYKFYKLSKKH